MVATVSFNPMLTSTALGTFNVQTDGYVQGMAQDSPNNRNDLVGGVLATTETKPMWGGVAVSEAIASSTINATNSNPSLGGIITRATNVTANTAATITGFSVFDQAHGMISSPQSPVPLAGTGMTVNFYRLGSFARVVVACQPDLISLQTGVIVPQVSWDFTNSVLQPYDAATATQAVTSMTWSNTNGGQIAVVVTAASTILAVGDVFTISGATNTGNFGNSAVNGSFVVNTWTDSQHFTFLAPGTASNYGTIAGTILLNYGVGLLPVKVLDVQVGNSMTVSYNATTGFATWNRSGSCALIQI